MRDLGSRLADEAVDWDWQRLQFRCFNHILNLGAHAALDEIKDDISKVYIVLFLRLRVLIF